MNTKSILKLASLVVLIAAQDLNAQSRVDAPMLLERASHAQMVEGDLGQAVNLYKQVAMSPTASRKDVAVALVELGNTYALQGSPEATSAFERVVSEFSDQPELFMVASNKLNNLNAASDESAEPGKQPAGANFTIVSEEVSTTQLSTPRKHDLSPDGTQLLIVLKPTGERKKQFPKLRLEAYLRDVNGSVSQPMIEDAEDWEYINQVRWSPNGKFVFYSRSKRTSAASGERQLMLLDVETGESRRLKGYFQEVSEDMLYGGVEWMSDNQALLIQTREDFHLIGLDGQVKKKFPGKSGHRTALGEVSPDGRYMLYHRMTKDKEDHNEMDIWKLDLETGESSQLTNDNGYEGWPVWGAGGNHIYYISGPESSRNVYRRKANLDATPIQITNFSNASAVYPRMSAAGQKLTFSLIKHNHLVFTAQTDDMDTAHSVVRGGNAMLSPDGSAIYYVDMQPGRVGLWRVEVDGDNPQQLVKGKVLTSYGPNALLSPDGSRIAYSQYTGDSTTLFVMPSGGGEPQRLYSAKGVRHLIPSWSPDGKEIGFSIDGRLMVISANGGEAEVLAEVKGWESWSFEWSPDGKHIAGFAYLEGEESNHIMMVERASKKLTRVTPKSEGRYKEILAWHPDGHRISYMYYNTEDGNGSRIIDLRTSEITDLVDMPDPNWDYVGIWGPDKRYYFNSVPRGYGNWGLYAVKEGEQEYQQVRKLSRASVSLPSWSADGTRMAWSEETVVGQLWMMTDFE